MQQEKIEFLLFLFITRVQQKVNGHLTCRYYPYNDKSIYGETSCWSFEHCCANTTSKIYPSGKNDACCCQTGCYETWWVVLPIVILFVFIGGFLAVVFAILFEKRRRKRATQGRIITENRISIDVPSINQTRPYYSNSNLFYSQSSSPNPVVYFENSLTPSIHTNHLNHQLSYQANNPTEAIIPLIKPHQ